MKKIKSFEDLERYKSILKKIRQIYSVVMNIPTYDLLTVECEKSF